MEWYVCLFHNVSIEIYNSFIFHIVADDQSVTNRPWATLAAVLTHLYPSIRSSQQSPCDQHGAHLGPACHRWAPCWTHQPCYQGGLTFRRIYSSRTLWRSYRSVNYIIVDSIYGSTQFPQPMGLLPKTQNCRLRMPRECRKRFLRHRPQRKPLVSNPGMHEARAVMHAEIANPWWWGKRSPHSRCMRNPQFYVSGKRPMLVHLL